jgi:hypothetical protein
MKIDDLLLMVYYVLLYTIIMMAKAYHCRTPGNPWIGSTGGFDGFAVFAEKPTTSCSRNSGVKPALYGFL